jgi:hypothetical protein
MKEYTNLWWDGANLPTNGFMGDILFIDKIHQVDLIFQRGVFMKGYADVYKDGANLSIDVTLGDILCIANIYQVGLDL